MIEIIEHTKICAYIHTEKLANKIQKLLIVAGDGRRQALLAAYQYLFSISFLVAKLHFCLEK